MSDFNDRPFVAGSLIGMRAFAIDKWGRLRGPAFDQIFTPDENVAECRKPAVSRWASLMPPMSFLGCTCPSCAGLPPGMGGHMRYEVSTTANEPKEVEAPPHDIGSVGCTCGFYAYFDGGNDFKERDRITALIEGFGVCTVGTRGFRAQKARLVSLVRSQKLAPHLSRALERNYPDVEWFDRKRDALEAHPLSQQELPTPESIDDFWTRSAS